MKEVTITLNTQEQKRAMVLNRIQAGQLSVAQAAGVLDLSARHVRRILAAYEKEGPADHPWRKPVIASKRTQSSSGKGETVT
jgi:predicted ArsR family transcriptional regulator